MGAYEHGAALPPGVDDLIGMIAHGLGTRLLVIRCCAELVAGRNGETFDPELATLLETTGELSGLLRELAPLARAAAGGGAGELSALAASVARLFPAERVLRAGPANPLSM